MGKLKHFLNEEWENPSEDFTRYLIAQIYDGVRTRNTIEKFEPIIKKAFKQFINELVNSKLNAALKNTSNNDDELKKDSNINVEEMQNTDKKNETEIVTTEEEIEGYVTVKISLKDIIDQERIYYRDNLSYFNILLDDNIRRWICRLGFNQTNKYIQLNDEKRTTYQIEKVSDIANYKNELINVVKKFT